MTEERISEKKRILIIVPTLQGGGAEGVCVAISNFIALKDPLCKITIACLEAKGDLMKNVNAEIQIVDLNHPSVYLSIFKILKLAKKLRPNIIIGWMGYLNAYLIFFKPLFSSRIKWYCRESSLPSELHKYFKNAWLFNFLYRFYNRYEKIICQSNAMAEDLKLHYKVNPGKISIINNPLKKFNTYLPEQKEKLLPESKYRLLYVGRLHHVKRIPILVELMRYLDDSYTLTIVGEGEEKQNVENLIISNNLCNKVQLVGAVNNPSYYYQNASCLLISSRYEGFPNVVIEAMSYGCPVVGYDIAGGAKEILDSYGGVYIENGKSILHFSQVIREVCEERSFEKNKIISSTLEKYSLEKIGGQYYNLLYNT